MTDEYKIKIVLVDQRNFVRAGFCDLFAAIDDIECVGVFSTLPSAVMTATPMTPDVVVVGQGTDTADATHDLVEVDPPPAVLAINVVDASTSSDVSASLARHIRAASQARIRPDDLPRTAPTSSPVLTSRQLDVLREVSAGRSAREIAVRLGVTEKTIDHHRQQLFARLGVHSRAAAVATGYELGLLTDSTLAGGRR